MIPEIEKLPGFEKIVNDAIQVAPDYPDKPIYCEYPQFEYLQKISNLIYPRNKRWSIEHNDYLHYFTPFQSTGSDWFAKRYIDGKIDTSFKDEFESSPEIIATLIGYGINIEAFWYLVLFIKDVVDGMDKKVIKNSATMDIDEIINLLKTIDVRPEARKFSETQKKKPKLIISINGHKYEYDNPITLKALAYCLFQGEYFCETNNMNEKPEEFANQICHWGFEDEEDINVKYEEKIHCQASMPIDKPEEERLPITDKRYFFYKYMMLFLEDEKYKYKKGMKQKIDIKDLPEKARPNKGSAEYISYDKKFLISRLIYIIGYGKESKDRENNFFNNPKKLNDCIRDYEKGKFRNKEWFVNYHYKGMSFNA